MDCWVCVTSGACDLVLQLAALLSSCCFLCEVFVTKRMCSYNLQSV